MTHDLRRNRILELLQHPPRSHMTHAHPDRSMFRSVAALALVLLPMSCTSAPIAQTGLAPQRGFGIDRDVDVRPFAVGNLHYDLEWELSTASRQLVVHVAPSSKADGVILPIAFGDDGGTRLTTASAFRYSPWRAVVTRASMTEVSIGLYQRTSSQPSGLVTVRLPAVRTSLADSGPTLIGRTDTEDVFQARVDGLLFNFSVTTK